MHINMHTQRIHSPYLSFCNPTLTSFCTDSALACDGPRRRWMGYTLPLFGQARSVPLPGTASFISGRTSDNAHQSCCKRRHWRHRSAQGAGAVRKVSETKLQQPCGYFFCDARVRPPNVRVYLDVAADQYSNRRFAVVWLLCSGSTLSFHHIYFTCIISRRTAPRLHEIAAQRGAYETYNLYNRLY